MNRRPFLRPLAPAPLFPVGRPAVTPSSPDGLAHRPVLGSWPGRRPAVPAHKTIAGGPPAFRGISR